MKHEKKLCLGGALLVFIIQLIRNLLSTPESGMVSSGAAPEPMAVVIAALLTALVTWVILRLMFAILKKYGKR